MTEMAAKRSALVTTSGFVQWAVTPMITATPALRLYVRYMYTDQTGRVRFEWDPAKAFRNVHKLGVTFLQASTAFSDEQAVLLDDPDPVDGEDRYVLLGLSATLRVLVVVHCYRDADRTIRLISARKATRIERAHYDARFRS